MKQPALILFVKFKSRLSLDEVMGVVNSRIEDFRALRGLKQKYYVQDSTTGEYGGVYLWESGEAFDVYRESELRKTIGVAYETLGEPRVEVFNVLKALHEDVG